MLFNCRAGPSVRRRFINGHCKMVRRNFMIALKNKPGLIDGFWMSLRVYSVRANRDCYA